MKKLPIFFIAVFFVLLGTSLAWAPCGISGYIYCDVDQDGTFSDGDEPLEGVVILLDGAYGATTDFEGRYEILSHELCQTEVMSLDVTTLPDDHIFINPSVNNVPYERIDSPPHVQDWAIYSKTCVPDEEYNEGCTIGFWKNNAGLVRVNKQLNTTRVDDNCWLGCYSSGDTLGGIFAFPESLSSYETVTLIEALKNAGTKEDNMLRQAVAALLNECSEKIAYHVSEAGAVIDIVNNALATGDYTEADKFVTWNESEVDDVCINNECQKSGKPCIDGMCESVHNCPIDSDCFVKGSLPMTLYTTFDVFYASEHPVSCGGN